MHIFVSILAGGLLLFAGAWAWWQLVERRFTVLTPAEVMRAGAMNPGTLRRTVRAHGIRAVFDLRRENEGDVAGEKATLEAIGCRHIHLPSTQVPDDGLRNEFLELIGNPENRPALIHCTHGEGRAVLYGALWLIEYQKMAPETARKKTRWLTTKGSTFDVKREKGKYLQTYQKVRS